MGRALPLAEFMCRVAGIKSWLLRPSPLWSSGPARQLWHPVSARAVVASCVAPPSECGRAPGSLPYGRIRALPGLAGEVSGVGSIGSLSSPRIGVGVSPLPLCRCAQ